MSTDKTEVAKSDLSAIELKTLARVSRPGPYVGLNGKAVQRLIELGLVKTRVSGYVLTEEGMARLRD
ncbi:hypothetical protein OSH11_23390 [Kaistia dalseonensis]|uniref:Ribosomal protein S19E (S16A) n=1 Tax=Kaistia dalseonensis TaxID=410840 RepID=A0ABU0HFK7_9HYPH|nr:hypothetical protein [Kaistia dalseonensis]MCX5497662.1 hypothetical protein [Kaistia dalseonensis]MDQ0440306.1 ribosomal protein S19E (S16A) [Kaistia dalseonensis]